RALARRPRARTPGDPAGGASHSQPRALPRDPGRPAGSLRAIRHRGPVGGSGQCGSRPGHGGHASRMSKIPEIVVSALAPASLYALIGVGFVLIYKATRVINFLQGRLAFVGALLLVTAYAQIANQFLIAITFGHRSRSSDRSRSLPGGDQAHDRRG